MGSVLFNVKAELSERKVVVSGKKAELTEWLKRAAWILCHGRHATELELGRNASILELIIRVSLFVVIGLVVVMQIINALLM